MNPPSQPTRDEPLGGTAHSVLTSRSATTASQGSQSTINDLLVVVERLTMAISAQNDVLTRQHESIQVLHERLLLLEERLKFIELGV